MSETEFTTLRFFGDSRAAMLKEVGEIMRDHNDCVFSSGEIWAALIGVNRDHCYPTLDIEEVTAIARAVTGAALYTDEDLIDFARWELDARYVALGGWGVLYITANGGMSLSGHLKTLGVLCDTRVEGYQVEVEWRDIDGRVRRSTVPRDSLL